MLWKDKMRVLVSGIASDIGFGVGRILRDWNNTFILYGMDLHLEHAGNFVFDECLLAPPASDESYIDWLKNIINSYKIDIFIPTSEAEISKISSLNLDNDLNVKILCNQKFVVNNSLDKHACMNLLAKFGISVPANGIAGGNKPDSYPIIVKPRSGQGSKGIKIIKNESEMYDMDVNYIWQELLLPDNEEYTCPVFVSSKNEIRILIIKRKLVGGLTGSGIVVENREIYNYVKKIVQVLGVKGVINIQLRLTKNGPLLFEINPRLSSTVVFRDKMGFQDLKWWISDSLGLPIPEYIPPAKGTFFFRGTCEYISKI